MDDVEKIILAVAIVVSTIIYSVSQKHDAEFELEVEQISQQLRHAPGPVE
jgi:hypothetical protein